MNKIFMIFFLIVQVLFCQDLRVIAVVNENDRNFLEYRSSDEINNSFAIDSSKIYLANYNTFQINSMYLWKYKEIFSTSNPKIIKNFRALDIKKNGLFITNTALDIINLKNNELISIISEDNKYVPDYQDKVRFSINDSIIYYFNLDGRFTSQNDSFIKYNLRTKTKQKIDIFNFLKNSENVFGQISDIYVHENQLFLINSELDRKSKNRERIIYQWDMIKDEQINRFQFPTYIGDEKILGTNKWENLFIFYRVPKHEYTLILMSLDLKVIIKIDVEKLISKMTFFQNNNYLEEAHGSTRTIIASFDDDKILYFMVKTVKGLYFIEYDYLHLLKEHFRNKSLEELRILRNTIFARHGRTFKSLDLQRYFESKKWYKKNQDYNDSMLSDFDKKCIDFIKMLELEKKD